MGERPPLNTHITTCRIIIICCGYELGAVAADYQLT